MNEEQFFDELERSPFVQWSSRKFKGGFVIQLRRPNHCTVERLGLSDACLEIIAGVPNHKARVLVLQAQYRPFVEKLHAAEVLWRIGE